MINISLSQFSSILSEYPQRGNPPSAFQLFHRTISSFPSILQTVKSTFYIQRALCEMFITNSEDVQITIPTCIFDINKLCKIFNKIIILAQNNEIVDCTVSLSISDVEQLLNCLINTPFLHPLLNESIIYCREAGPVTANMDISFAIYESLYASSTLGNKNDTFIRYSDSHAVPTYTSIPAYMPLCNLEKNCQLLDHYNLKFDKILLIGHTANEEFINHAIICFS